ncbi:hypothetical protein [Hydrocarboniphaga sp.]|uniref:hypothetical protein n=1 Tax=Hydrocarboniphaga sp. TaxID=2033016 RepID=UPI003D102520
MNTKIQLLCVWSGPVFLVLYLLAFWGLAGYLPPHPPGTSASDIAAFYDLHHNQIRAGMVLCLIFSTLLFPWFAVISAQIADVEGRFPVMAMMQFGGGVLLIVFFVICSMLWIAATYRPDLDPNVIRMMHETSWLIFVMVFPAYTLQLSCIAVSGFMDKRPQPWLPRWACYLNLWVGFSAFGGGFAAFFKSGPFAWNGVFGFWLPVLMFTLWLFVMAPLMARSIKRRALA